MTQMNTVVVHRAFECKLTKTVFFPGDTYVSDDPERIKFLQAEGYLADTPPPIAKRVLRLTENVADEQKNDVSAMGETKAAKRNKKAR
ncbi:MAG TPA: hypothetical protein VLH56_04525 [Dissulfurispiraceae bacterium]|nr:hypothetical protein [Dissulfurispiraceae bacterium]